MNRTEGKTTKDITDRIAPLKRLDICFSIMSFAIAFLEKSLAFCVLTTRPEMKSLNQGYPNIPDCMHEILAMVKPG
jgi:hypothetical protein